MKTFKEFKTYANLPLLTEEEHKELIDLINKHGQGPPEQFHKNVVIGLGKRLGGLLGSGSSRAAYIGGHITIPLRQYNKDKSMYTVTSHKVPIVHKIAMPHHTSYDSVREPGEKLLGQLQNQNEAHPHFDSLRTYIKHEDGTYSHNPHGILPTVFHAHPDGSHIVSERGESIETSDFHKTHGIHLDDFGGYLMSRFNHARRGLTSPTKGGIDVADHQDHYEHNLTNDHPLVKTWNHLVSKGFHPGDFVEDNLVKSIGHPGTPKILLADSGFLRPHSPVEGLHNTVEEYSVRADQKNQMDRAKRRMGIPLTPYSGN